MEISDKFGCASLEFRRNGWTNYINLAVAGVG